MKYTNRHVAETFNLWQEYVDPNANMTENEFNALTVDEREVMVEEAFGTDADQAEASDTHELPPMPHDEISNLTSTPYFY